MHDGASGEALLGSTTRTVIGERQLSPFNHNDVNDITSTGSSAPPQPRLI